MNIEKFNTDFYKQDRYCKSNPKFRSVFRKELMTTEVGLGIISTANIFRGLWNLSNI